MKSVKGAYTNLITSAGRLHWTVRGPVVVTLYFLAPVLVMVGTLATGVLVVAAFLQLFTAIGVSPSVGVLFIFIGVAVTLTVAALYAAGEYLIDHPVAL